ncbi:MAG: glycosyltransferase family 4 protein [Candidatus Sericytochromatia bacterium]|nr:glycosyltransferase family 4 protein [Candidatus Sericytochromatia bacterium]
MAPARILQVCAIDSTAWLLLRAQLLAMRDAGWEVHVACSDGPALPRLRALGLHTHAVPIARSTNVAQHAASVLRLRDLMVRERFDMVHVHTPVAAMVGRVAARLAGVPHVAYTAHGFYFHDEMPPGRRRRHVWLERGLGRLTDLLLTQSAEDAATAVREGIMPAGAVQAIGNGVPVAEFAAVAPERVEAWRRRLGIGEDQLVVGTVGRLVEEKGFREFFLAARAIATRLPEVAFLVVGGAFPGDRDGFQAELARLVAQPPLKGRVHFTGYTEDIPPLMHLMDVFTLPSYREGMPRSILEAMAAGRPVVATDIRGCREEVVEGETGFLVPTRDVAELANRLERLVVDPGLRARLGAAGQARAAAEFDEAHVCERVVAALAAELARV